MVEISKCANKDCPIKEKCHRWTAKDDEKWQSYAKFEYNIGCEFFIPNKENNDN